MVSKDVVYFPERLILEFLTRFIILKCQMFIIVVLKPVNYRLQYLEILEEDLEKVDTVKLTEKTSVIDCFDRFLEFVLLLKTY